MSELLTLARDYIDRMANPSYGYVTNEDYSLRFAQLLTREGFESSLRDEIRASRDTDALTSNGWLWLIQWARTRQIEMDEDLLLGLFEEWSSLPARCAIVDLATYKSELRPGPDSQLSEFPHRFLARIMRAATQTEDLKRKDRPLPERLRLTARAESVLVVFLQVGTPLTLAAATALLRYRWQGHDELSEYLILLAETLDPETRKVWGQRLGIRLSRESRE
jgi:hypothetical protein